MLTQNITITVTAPGFLGVSLYLSDSGINAVSDYVFMITTSNTVPANGVFEFVFPSCISIPSVLSCINTVSCQKINNNTVDAVYSSFAVSPSTFNVTIKSVKNFNVTGTFYFSITSKNDSYLIDSNSGVSVVFTCYTPCATCNTTGNNCLSCLSTNPYLYNNTCYKSCPSGTTSIISGTCSLCSSPCTECYSSLSNCTSCTSPLFLFNNTCVSSCPSKRRIMPIV